MVGGVSVGVKWIFRQSIAETIKCSKNKEQKKWALRVQWADNS